MANYIANVEYKATTRHYLVPPGDGDQDEEVQLEVLDRDKLRDLGLPEGQTINQKVKLVVHPGQGGNPFDAEMIPAAYAEKVAVGATGEDRQPLTSCASFLDIHSPQRVKSSVELGPGLKPVGYEDRVVCYTECSKKRFKSTVDYVPKYKAKAFGETRYVLPQRTDTTYVSLLDYGDGGPAGPRRWYTSKVTMVPRTYSHNSVHNFQVMDSKEQSMDFESEDEECSSDSASSTEDVDMLSPTSNGHTDIHLQDISNKHHNGNLDTKQNHHRVKDYVVESQDDPILLDANENYQNGGTMADSGYYGNGTPSLQISNGYPSYTTEEDDTIDEL